MESRYIDIDGKWGIVVNYDYDLMDYDDMFAIMRSFGLSEMNAKRALRILSSYNTGMAISNEGLRMSAIFISKATSPSEWWSSCLHELRHCARAITDYYGTDLEEDDAYLTGFLTKRAVEILGEPCF